VSTIPHSIKQYKQMQSSVKSIFCSPVDEKNRQKIIHESGILFLFSELIPIKAKAVHGKLQQAFVCGEYHPNVIHEGGSCYCNLSFEHKSEVLQYCKNHPKIIHEGGILFL
jgi:hypothetical protein